MNTNLFLKFLKVKNSNNNRWRNHSIENNNQKSSNYGRFENQTAPFKSNNERYKKFKRERNEPSIINVFNEHVEKTASNDVQRFWNELYKRVVDTNKKKFELHIDEYNIWLETWKAAAGGANGPINILPIAYMRLPALTEISPSPNVIISVFIQILNKINTTQIQKDLPTTINVLEAIFDTIKLRLINLIQENSEQLLKATTSLEDILFPTIIKCISTYPKDAESFAHLITKRNYLNDLKKKIKNSTMLKNQQPEQLDSNGNNKPWLGWQQKPDLNWLMSGSWHKIEGLKAKYDSTEDYTETLLRLWTLLTFYWGSGTNNKFNHF
jgi:hypothetical protein